MKKEIRDDSKNYTCVVVKLPPKQAVVGLDKLVKVTVFGNDVLTQKDTDENGLYLFFPAECQISEDYLSKNNEFRHKEKNADKTKGGFFEDTARVKAIKFKGVISSGYIAPISTLIGVVGDDHYVLSKLKEGDEFTDLDGVNICKKYKITYQQSTSTESRHNKKLKRFDKLVPNQFRFHQDTSQLARNLHLFEPDQIVVITDKWHGTSAIYSNVLVNKKLNWVEKLAKKLGLDIVDKVYDKLYASRSVIKNQYINKEVTAGFYNEDIWGVVDKEVREKIEQGITLYGEIVGYLASGKMIQKNYDYGALRGEHKFLVYRITYTKPDGNVIEFSWQQIKDYCKKYSLETVRELYFGRLSALPIMDRTMFEWLQFNYLEQDCKYCVSKVPAEGIVVRIDGKDTYSAYKLKAKRFLEGESKTLDGGEVNIEDLQDDGYAQHTNVYA